MKYISTIQEYYQHINVPLARHEEFDARSFKENMPTVRRHIQPFQHEFYAIGILFSGTSHQWHGIKNMEANLVFNSPYQLISWNIENDWEGYYIVFSQDFLLKCHFGNQLLVDFPFLKLDEIAPFSIPNEHIAVLSDLFQKIIAEIKSNHRDKFAFIESYLNLLLLNIKRFTDTLSPSNVSHKKRTADIALISRYQTLIENKLNETVVNSDYFATSFYAQELAIHPNHLNAIAKRITGKTAKQLIQEKILQSAKSLLLQTEMSVKEVAYQLGYKETSHFHNFFKKNTSLTPVQFRAVGQV
ncbi:MAG: helix-turn-helix domain-containing protein [Bacteroidota bacterium]